MMDTGKIFLAKLSEGLCGAENSYLLGTLLVSKFQQLAMSRQSQAASERRDFWLYVDEFDHFISPSMSEILKGARKYRLGLTLGHQELHQLQSEPKVASAVMTQPCTRIVFRVGDDDAKKLGEGFSLFDAQSLKTLEKFHAIVRVERNDFDFNLALRKPELSDFSEARKEAVIAASRARYATPRADLRGDQQEAPPESDAPPTGTRPRKPKPSPPASTTDITIEAVVIPSPPAEIPQPAEPPKAAEIPKVIVPPPSVAEPPKPAAKKAELPKDLGRGGAQHQAIQKRIKDAAEGMGFRSVIEKPVLDGQGSVDLWLERNGQSIACEISITTTIDHEVGNVAKCLKAGVPKVAVICLEDERLRKIAAAVSGSLGTEPAARVEYFQPDPFINYLKQLVPPTPSPSETQYGGYRVKRSMPKLSATEQQQKEDIAHRIMAESIRQK
jgi:hypothetical protein